MLIQDKWKPHLNCNDRSLHAKKAGNLVFLAPKSQNNETKNWQFLQGNLFL